MLNTAYRAVDRYGQHLTDIRKSKYTAMHFCRPGWFEVNVFLGIH